MKFNLHGFLKGLRGLTNLITLNLYFKEIWYHGVLFIFRMLLFEYINFRVKTNYFKVFQGFLLYFDERYTANSLHFIDVDVYEDNLNLKNKIRKYK